MLWPYVRNPGDCLTDSEIKAGQAGVYNGPVNTNPDVSGIKVETPAQGGPLTGTSGPTTSPAPGTSTTSAGTGTTGTQRNADVSCHKGLLWPFSRSPGDCLTNVEKKEGHAGVYRADAVVTQVSATGAASGTGANNSGGSTAAASNDTSTAPPVQTCSKGALWPFVRHPGDCPTDAEKRRGK
jgi:hypothetical protein